MEIENRFIGYTTIDTTSNEHTRVTPSSKEQLVLGKMLMKEMNDIGLENVTQNQFGIVSGVLKGNGHKNIALIAHMDTSPDAPGNNIKAKIIRDYQGGDIVLADKDKLLVKDNPQLNRQIGHDLIVTDGTTLLGGDDKAGIAIILDAVEKLTKVEKEDRVDVTVIFTPDEEIGEGADHVEVKDYNCDFGVTVDGGSPYFVNIENFNAASAIIKIQGKSIHPGSAKGKMVNAGALATRFNLLIPNNQRPTTTEGREGFFHLTEVKGSVEYAELHYILRDHDLALLKEKERKIRNFIDISNDYYGHDYFSCEITESYYNMIEELKKHPEVIYRLKDAYENLDVDFEYEPIRGGTDGARLSFMGLPCPNIGTGDYNCHGRHEYVDIDEMKLMSRIVQQFVTIK